jgi:hypothetical protein
MLVFEVFVTQKLAIEEAQKKGEKFYFAVDKGDGGKKEYGSCPDCDTFSVAYEHQEPKNFYELLYEKNPVCEYYDIDMSAVDNTDNLTSEQYFDLFQQIHSQFVNEELGLSFQTCNWRITDSSKDGKISLHLINRRRVFKNNEETQYWYSLFERFLKNNYPNLALFDTAVKSKNRCMRLIKSSKFGQNRPLERAKWHEVSMNEDDITSFFIQQVNEDYECSEQLAQIKIRMDKKIETEKAVEKEVKTFVKKFKKEVVCVDKDENEPELLISLITEMIKAEAHSLCDTVHKSKLGYANMRNLAFAFCNSATYKEDDAVVSNYITTEIYPLYRHASQYSPSAIVDQIVKSGLGNATKDKIYTIASLHFWAKENPKYSSCFSTKSKSEGFKSYDEMKEEFERTNFKLNYETLYCETVGSGKIIRRVEKKLKESRRNMLLWNEESEKQDEFVSTWIRDATIRNYNTCGVFPEGCDEKTFNLWTGFRAEKFKPEGRGAKQGGNCDSFINLVKRLCNYNEEHFQFVIKVIAQMIQQPHKKPGLCLVIKSFQGAGKDTLYKILEAVIGSTYCFNTADVERDIFGRFNDAIENKILIALNECSVVQTGKHSQKFKDFITCSTDKIEEKGIALREVRSMCRYFVFTNGDFATNIEESDRRFFVIDCKEPKLSMEESGRIYKDIDDETAIRAFYDYLMSIDIQGFDFVSNRPRSQYQEDLKEACLPIEYLFLRELKDRSEGKTKIFTSDLYAMYLTFTSELGYNADKNCKLPMFSLKISKYATENESGVSKASHGNIRVDGKQSKGFEFDYGMMEKRFC